MKNERTPPPNSNAGTMSLEGEEAAELYTMEIVRNLAGLREKVGLLHAEIAKSKRLLDQINSGLANQSSG